MRKQTKLVAVLSAAALLAIGASMTSFAATPHWEDQDGVWVYLDSNGERVTNEWKKSNNAYYYLDDNGEMSIDMWIDSDYYVGTDGKMITNNWAKLTPEDGGDSDPDGETEHWFYFDSKGKKANNEKKTINGKVYYFDNDGYMEHGWYQDDTGDSIFYLGDVDDGARKTGWMWLEADTGEDGWDQDCEDCDNEGWYYFDTNGKLYKKSGEKTINGKKYYFNKDGQMLYNWIIKASESNDTNIKDTDETTESSNVPQLRYAFDVEKGSRVSGWLKVDGSYTAGTDGDNNWYSFKDGNPRKATNNKTIWFTDSSSPRKREIISVDGKKFCFDQNGKMKTGLQAVPTTIGGTKESNQYDTYYFDDNGNMKTGKVSNVSLDNGDTASFYFATSGSNKGKGITGEKDGYLYFQGKRLEADSDYKFYSVKEGTGDGAKTNTYLVNKSGKIQVYSKGTVGKKIDSGKLENGSTSSYGDYVYLHTDNNGVVNGLYKKASSTAQDDKYTLNDVTTPNWETLGWED